MAEHNDFGKEAEIYAGEYLRGKGYQLITKNYRFQKAEIDLIAKKNQTLIVIEVKARREGSLVEPQSAVDKKKIRLILSATEHFLEHYPDEVEVRFDIISIYKNSNGEFELQHIEDAFESIS